eukprot:jgi/Mesen1/1323/ME000013S00813
MEEMEAGALANSGLGFWKSTPGGPANSRLHLGSGTSEAKIRSEVIAPFRTVRMFFYVAFMASAGLGALISLTHVAGAVGGAANADPLSEILQGLAIDVVAIAVFAFLFRSDYKAEKASVAKIEREEELGALRLELANKKVVSLTQLRGTSRLVILAGPLEFCEEALERAEPVRAELEARGVLVAPFVVGGPSGKAKGDGQSDTPGGNLRWKAVPIYTNEWSRYISLRLDGRVRASGVGYPPWQKFAAQLPPMKGIWKGPLDGMDGRV